ALRDQVTVTAVGRGDHVVGSKRGAYTRRHGLLPDILVRHSGDLVRVDEVDDPLFETSDRQHRPVQRVVLAQWSSQPKSRAALAPRTRTRSPPASPARCMSTAAIVSA